MANRERSLKWKTHLLTFLLLPSPSWAQSTFWSRLHALFCQIHMLWGPRHLWPVPRTLGLDPHQAAVGALLSLHGGEYGLNASPAALLGGADTWVGCLFRNKSHTDTHTHRAEGGCGT